MIEVVLWVLALLVATMSLFCPGLLGSVTRVLVFMVLVLIFLSGPSAARGQSHDASILARVTAGEVGLRRVTDDAPAIHRVFERRAARQGVRWQTMAWRYSDGHLRRTGARERRWVAWLRRDGLQPRGWPETAAWGRYRGAWLRLLELAEDVVQGRVRAPCDPDHFGSPDPRLPDVHRARRAGWVRVSCGDTIDGYWSVR